MVDKVDKIVSVPRTRVSRTIGRCDAAQMSSVHAALRGWLALD
jgi:mRNA-degrading endonuclease toxin of MazEF toxin-antitoxin module